MRKILSLLLALMMTFSLAACELPFPVTEETTEAPQQTQQTQPTVPPTTEAVDLEAVQRQLFYDYLQDVHIPEVGLADLGTISWTHASVRGGVDSNAQHLLDNGRGGLLSAVVRDFDLDGDQDMVTFYMEAIPYGDTWPAIYSGSNLVHNISMSLYTLENEEIVLSDSYPCAILLDGYSWGYINIRMEQLEDGIYIYSYSDATDYQTYGASPRTIFHVADNHFVFDYIGGIRYGQSSLDENPNLLMNTTNINPSDYTFDSIELYATDVDPNGDERENRWIYHAEFTSPDDDDVMSYTGTDYTGLRIILENGLEAFPHNPLPQGGKKPPNPTVELAKSAAQTVADHVATQSGCTIINSTSYYSEYDNTATIRFETEEYTILSVSFDGNTNRIYGVSVSTNDYPVPQEWFDMKDALLQFPDFGLLTDELSPFLGKRISYNNHMNGTPITGATITILQITDTTFRIGFTE